ncbi:alpha/beta hydrolase family protein [Nitratireductor luteus]|uniref:alpha/beta hydrolase family protein n=1 Tax=Nitratireductor luteus TaxID=2976980 RepID=UPI00223E9F3E|nr:alpha/beta hydrolase [Nitratireductor luteus]
MAAGIFRLVLLLFFALPASAGAFELPPFKDRLFAYPGILSQKDGGDYRVVDYREMRDINGRDAVPERRVKGSYVDTGVRRAQQDLALKTGSGLIRHFAVGRTERANLIVVYLHGQGGSRRQGVDDFTFGGNFNRIKNLMARNGGLYLAPDITDFSDKGTAEVAALLSHYVSVSPGAPVFLACGSMGGALCWRLARDERLLPRLGGLLLLGSVWDEGFIGSKPFERRLPVFIGHGSNDTVFPVERQEAFYTSVRRAVPGYPIRMVRFQTGTHGTPIRMTDWRETLNWMLSLR